MKEGKESVSFNFALTTLYIWLERNNILFNENIPNVPEVVDCIKWLSWSWFIIRDGRNKNLVFSNTWTNPFPCLIMQG